MLTKASFKMNTPIDNLDRSLRCLAHYSVVFCVLLLFVNDHYLKYHFPGFITGKMSDFAGLYFFPFLVLFPLSIFFNKPTHKHRLGILSYAFVAAFFVGIKTVPIINEGVETLLSLISGGFSIIVLDPSDLIALPALFLSWRLWNGEGLKEPRWYVWIIVSLAVFSSLATSCRETGVLRELYTYDGLIYTGDTRWDSWFVSEDKGRTWERLSVTPSFLEGKKDHSTKMPKTICDMYDDEHCFRISGEERVEASVDGGKTWSVAWEIPPGRRKFIERRASLGLCPKRIDLGPYDIEWVGDSGVRSVVVALGNEGILIITKDGSTSRVSVNGYSTPSSYRASSFVDGLMTILGETATLSSLGVLWWVIANLIYWKPVLAKIESISPEDNQARWIISPLRKTLISLAIIVVLGLILFQYAFGLALLLNFAPIRLLFIAGLLGSFIGQTMSWRRLSSVISDPADTKNAIISLLVSEIALIMLGFIPLYFWTISIINHYHTAVIGSICLLFLVIILSVKWVRSQVHSTIELLQA